MNNSPPCISYGIVERNMLVKSSGIVNYNGKIVAMTQEQMPRKWNSFKWGS